ncbi:acetate kinase [Clostridium baratii]|uniref:Acetate kinase n=1 Tax=Clostridium baratii TaxID=1561 RepID=A0A174Q5J9_9CLOT|nr:acetate kinase [Clostridium baratii]OPF51748.1 acetate kinase [Clostridium baratii]OPF53393.1 acetate kinase [Clostridium baratii]OPF57462.1 acetate kinase [Clostridium baratii]OPF60440.1 acetate kinase [Clostridium baratii]CUP68744.1 acetate kinase [Clostridium baratii]
MKILVINCGSSSLKYQLINMENEEVLAQGLVERIGIEGSILTQKVEGRDKYIIEQPMKDHQDAIRLVLGALVDETHGVIKSMDEISAVGHRVVHGGEKYSKSVLVDDEVMNYLEECVKLAPLHNPPNIIGINACKALMPNTPMAVVFDTAFHQTMPAKAFTYAIPYELYQKHGIRRYGFHGTSHKYVSRKVAEVMNKNIEDLKIITCHLGNGGSLTAVDGGKSVDTSMGFTPLEGIVMGTRSGNIDPAIVTYLINELGYTSEEVNTMLNKKSGLLGISELSSDFRDIRDAAFDRKEERAILTKDVFFYSIKKQIGAYAAAMGGVDVIVFTAGIGENSIETREGVLEGLEFLGVKLDKEKNAIRADINEISTDDSRVKAYVIATNEELMIAKETLELIN